MLDDSLTELAVLDNHHVWNGNFLDFLILHVNHQEGVFVLREFDFLFPCPEASLATFGQHDAFLQLIQQQLELLLLVIFAVRLVNYTVLVFVGFWVQRVESLIPDMATFWNLIIFLGLFQGLDLFEFMIFVLRLTSGRVTLMMTTELDGMKPNTRTVLIWYIFWKSRRQLQRLRRLDYLLRRC